MNVTNHAVERFVEKVAPVPYRRARSMLELMAEQVIKEAAGRRPRLHTLYPYRGRDLVLTWQDTSLVTVYWKEERV